MIRIGFLSSDKKLGPLARQREVIGEVDKEITPDMHDLLDTPAMFRPPCVVIVAHARAFGFHRGGYRRREMALEKITAAGGHVQIADGDPVMYDSPEKRAEFHAAAHLPTGVATPKQKRNAGRPQTYREPDGKDRETAVALYAGPLHTEEVGRVIGDMMRCPPISRATLHRWFGKRPFHPKRMRKPRSTAKKRKNQ